MAFLKYRFNRTQVKRVNSFKRYFKKQNGKIQVNELTALLNKVSSYHSAPKSINKIKALFDLKGSDSIEPVLIYSYSNDLENMIPSVDSLEFKALKAYVSKLNGLSSLNLDKVHTYLVNKQNRKTYTPSEPERFSIHTKLESLKGVKNLSLIETDRDLRREGREQNHCIGSKQYLEKMRRGYQALRFKGYTFFLSPKLEIVQTNGKHNSPTPESVESELLSLIQSKGA